MENNPPLLDAPFAQQKMTTIPHVVPCRNTGSLSRAALEVPDTRDSDRRDARLVSSLKCQYSAGRGMFETRIIDYDPHVTCRIINVVWGWSTFALLNVVVLHKLESRLTSDILQDI